MSEALFPTLPGQTWPRAKIIRHSTVVRQASGRRFALTQQLYPTYLLRIPYSFLRVGDLATLVAFFRARRGRLDTFRFDDRDDNTATAQPFGLGDGTTLAWQLLRTAGGFAEPVYAVAGSPTVYLDGVAASPQPTISALGLCTFATPPAAGKVLTWSGQYHWRCAFVRDEQEFDEFARQLYSTRQVEFETFHP